MTEISINKMLLHHKTDIVQHSSLMKKPLVLELEDFANLIECTKSREHSFHLQVSKYLQHKTRSIGPRKR